jgi:hypothetical protein
MSARIPESLTRGRRLLFALIVTVALGSFLAAQPASAAVEDINWRVFQNQPVADYFPNEFSLDYPKILEFKGIIENPTGFDGALTMFFDYVDPSAPDGTGITYTPPVTIDVPEFSTVGVTITETIPFCPALVSLHARTAGAELLELVGTFTHECQVPEPSTAVAAGLGLLCLGLTTRRRG